MDTSSLTRIASLQGPSTSDFEGRGRWVKSVECLFDFSTFVTVKIKRESGGGSGIWSEIYRLLHSRCSKQIWKCECLGRALLQLWANLQLFYFELDSFETSVTIRGLFVRILSFPGWNFRWDCNSKLFMTILWEWYDNGVFYKLNWEESGISPMV